MEKSTGWKVPIIFCGCFIAIIALLYIFLLPTRQEINLPAEMLEYAKSVKLDLSDPEGEAWKKRIVEAASGFRDYQSKDESLGLVGDEALRSVRFDAACISLAMMKGDASRVALAQKIFDAASGDCANIAWAIYATRVCGPGKMGEALRARLQPQWENCRRLNNAP